MKAILLENGNMLIPVRAEGPNGELGDCLKEVSPESPEYQKWLPFCEKENSLFNF